MRSGLPSPLRSASAREFKLLPTFGVRTAAKLGVGHVPAALLSFSNRNQTPTALIEIKTGRSKTILFRNDMDYLEAGTPIWLHSIAAGRVSDHCSESFGNHPRCTLANRKRERQHFSRYGFAARGCAGNESRTVGRYAGEI